MAGRVALIVREPLPPPAGLWLEDELLARGRPVVAVWRHQQSVIVGRSTPLGLEVDCDAARRLGVPVYRRRSGGGAVYHDPGNLNISLVLPARRPYPSLVYREGHRLVQGLLSLLGVESWRENEGDIVVHGWKVSGSAAYLTRDRALFHATLLVEADTSLLHMVVKPRLDRVERGEVTPAKYRPRNLSSIYPHMSLENVIRAIRDLATSRGWPLVETETLAPAPTGDYRELCSGGGGSASS